MPEQGNLMARPDIRMERRERPGFVGRRWGGMQATPRERVAPVLDGLAARWRISATGHEPRFGQAVGGRQTRSSGKTVTSTPRDMMM